MDEKGAKILQFRRRTQGGPEVGRTYPKELPPDLVIDVNEVGVWSCAPTEAEPANEVHVFMRTASGHCHVIRYRSREQLDVLIDYLRHYRKRVWGNCSKS